MNSLVHVHSRFAGEVVSVGTEVEGPADGSSPTHGPAGRRPLYSGDRVRQGQLLAVVWSKDVGEKKSELVDALSKLKADEVTLARLREVYAAGAGTERAVRDAERDVRAGRIAVERAERTLRSWRLTDAEVAAVRAEADQLSDPNDKGVDASEWARVEVRAPQDGVILEKNVVAGDVVDTTTELFKIGDVSHLKVIANVYEEDLPLIQSLPAPVRWTVTLPSRPGVSFPGCMRHISAVLDPAQHTALASGRVENPGGELKSGQFITASIEMPCPPGEVELPSEAVAEDGRESIVFVRPDPAADRYVRRPIHVVHRFRDVVYATADAAGVRPGETVVSSGVLLLRDAMDQLPAPAAR